MTVCSALISETMVDENPLLINVSCKEPMTSTTCGHIVVEIIKLIVYQKLQIPYPYDRLKFLVNLKRSKDAPGSESIASRIHYRTASTALDSLDLLFQNLRLEIDGAHIPREICLVFGATPLAAREMYRIILPAAYHKQQCLKNCSKTAQKLGLNVLRCLATSNAMQDMILNPMPLTNMYILMMKEVATISEESLTNGTFIPSNGYRVPRKSRVAIIDIGQIDQNEYSCCNNFFIFSDSSSKTTHICDMERKEKLFEIKSTDTARWYQSSIVLRGFKDCLVNGSSITNSWLQ